MLSFKDNVNAKLKQTAKLLGTSIIALGVYYYAPAQTFLTNGLVAYYPFNGNASDATGNGNNGEVHSAQLVQDRFGHPNAAYSFNGSNSFVLLTNSFSLSNEWTVSAWVRPSTLSQQAYIVHIGTDDETTFWFMSPSSNGACVGLRDGTLYDVTGAACAWGAFVVSDNNAWFQVVQRRGGKIGGVLIGGVFLNGNGPSGGACPENDPVQAFIGSGSQQSYFFNGTIDDVRVYNRALTDFEIQQLYAYEAGPVVTLQKAVRPAFSNLLLGTNYQLQVSADLTNWTNQGAPFTATNTAIPSQQYFDVDAFNGLFFRLQTAP